MHSLIFLPYTKASIYIFVNFFFFCGKYLVNSEKIVIFALDYIFPNQNKTKRGRNIQPI